MGKGVKGFRFDVVNLISKGQFEDDYEGDGRRFYTDGPNIHKYLKELHDMTFGTDAEIVTVGEMSSTSMENCYQYAGADTGELSMVFNFHHLKVDFMGNEKWVLVPADFGKLKQILLTGRHRCRNTMHGMRSFGATTISLELCPDSEVRINTGKNLPKCWEQ